MPSGVEYDADFKMVAANVAEGEFNFKWLLLTF
jgi:hypothetical protein